MLGAVLQARADLLVDDAVRDETVDQLLLRLQDRLLRVTGHVRELAAGLADVGHRICTGPHDGGDLAVEPVDVRRVEDDLSVGQRQGLERCARDVSRRHSAREAVLSQRRHVRCDLHEPGRSRNHALDERAVDGAALEGLEDLAVLHGHRRRPQVLRDGRLRGAADPDLAAAPVVRFRAGRVAGRPVVPGRDERIEGDDAVLLVLGEDRVAVPRGLAHLRLRDRLARQGRGARVVAELVVRVDLRVLGGEVDRHAVGDVEATVRQGVVDLGVARDRLPPRDLEGDLPARALLDGIHEGLLGDGGGCVRRGRIRLDRESDGVEVRDRSVDLGLVGSERESVRIASVAAAGNGAPASGEQAEARDSCGGRQECAVSSGHRFSFETD